MARAVTDDWYGPHYVVTEERTQPVAPVHTTVQVTTSTPRSVPPRQNAPPCQNVPPRPVPPRPAAVPQYRAVVSDHVMLSATPTSAQCMYVKNSQCCQTIQLQFTVDCLVCNY